MKKIAVSSLVGLLFLSCSIPVSNNATQDTSSNSLQRPLLRGSGVGSSHSSLNKDDFSDLEKEYYSFSTKALSNAYVSRMFGKYLNPVNSIQLTRQLEFSRYLKVQGDTSYETSLKSMFAQTPLLYNQMTAISDINQKMTSDSSNFGAYIIGLSPYPGTPVATNATNIATTSFIANWNAVSGATGYKLYIDGTPVTLGLVTSYSKTGLTAGSSHSYYVQAINPAGTSSSSNTINVTLIPSAPVATNATNIATTSFTANWNTVSGATGYKLYVDGSPVTLGLVTSYSKTGLTAGSSHSYYVQTINSAGTSVSSNTINVSLIPSAPVATSATNIATTSFTANWNTVSGATGYKLYIDGTPVTLGLVTSYSKTGLTAGSSHSYYVQATNSGGTSVSSNAINVTLPTGIPSAPVATAATNKGTESFTANWNTVSGATGYNLYLNEALVYTGANTSFGITGLTKGTSYSYYVQATNAGGTSANSNTINVTTLYLQLTEVNSIPTNGASNWEYFTIGTDHYLAIANAYNGSSYNIPSNIYKWNSSLGKFDDTPFQSFNTNGARDWEFFTIGTEHYLAVANVYNNSSYNIPSNIYKWNSSLGKFDDTPFQSINTNGARDWEYFTIGTEHYLALANNKNDSSFNLPSNIYKWNASTGMFNTTPIQSIIINCAYNWKFFTIGTDNYLVASNFRNGANYNLPSNIYKWNSSTGMFDSTPFQSINTSGATDWNHFTIGMDHYITVTNYYNNSSFNIPSNIYKWNSSTGMFDSTPFQSILQYGGAASEFFTIGSEHFLAVANVYNGSSYYIPSNIYKWDSSLASFNSTPIQSLSTIGAIDWKHFEINGLHYIALANYYNGSSYNVNSKIYRID